MSQTVASAEIDPAIAQKVLDTDVRNKVKKVADGGTLNSTERQIFLEMTEGTATPDQVREARVSALMRKWMDGGRLSLSERDEIAHLLPDAVAVNTEGVPLPQQPGALVEHGIKRIYQLSRAKYFRWKQQGASVPDGPDPPPFDQPKAMVAWYERMRERGIFKHKCPKLLKDLAAKGFPVGEEQSASTKRASQSVANAVPAGQTNGSSTARQAPEQRGFLVEHEKLEEHTAIMREDYLQAYAEGRLDEGNVLKQRYFEAYEMLRKSASQKEAIGLAEKSLAKTSVVMEILGTAIPAVVDTIASESESRALYEAAQRMSFDEFHQARRSRLKGSFATLHKSGFVPPLELAS